MLPWSPPRWGAGREEAPEGPGLPAGKDQGEPWSSGADAPRELGTPPWDSPQPPSRSPSWTRREQLLLPHHPPGPATEQPPGAPDPRSPQVAWEVVPSRITPLAPWDPKYEVKAGPRPVWGANCSSGASFSGRTLCHPSFWPLYEAASGRGLRPVAPATGHWNGQQAPPDAGFPVMCCEDIFLSDPLLPRGQRVPLYLSKAPQQVRALSPPCPYPRLAWQETHSILSPQMMGSLKLLPPPPIMSARVLPRPSPSRGPSTAWLSGPELIALTGLLQMSQGEPRPSSSAAGPPDPTSDPPSPCGSPSSSQGADLSLPQTPDTHCP
ncbi:histone deacetylase complex subunit SAP25 isoform X1 [Pongo abelii]|uniref:histone deacetylase complex subunit SAP25 isoform X1 n=1 Tax=Pongo abelii TaxID=9601 RepID=UPI0023E7666B|nr:histone deacetylase complex subunit SAP25 isoform X1 [Pongo abelii]